jgi:hypothetical protein
MLLSYFQVLYFFHNNIEYYKNEPQLKGFSVELNNFHNE